LTNVVWTGRKFVAYGDFHGAIGQGYITSSDGLTWSSPVVSPIGEIRDICFTPNTVNLTSDSSEYSRFFLSSNTIFSGSLHQNDYVNVKNIIAQPIEIFGSPGSNSAELQLPPAESSNGSRSYGAIVYSDGTYLFAV
jgi:hypothetical protein